MNRVLTKTYIANGAIPAMRFVKFSADGVVTLATAATDAIIGVTDSSFDVVDGQRVDVHHMGAVPVKAGGAITRGALVTSDANGKAVAAAPASGVNNSTGGRVLVSAANGDQPDVLLSFGQIQGQ